MRRIVIKDESRAAADDAKSLACELRDLADLLEPVVLTDLAENIDRN